MGLSPRKIGEGLYEPLAAINVTPLVDVMLVLLIIFMVTAPMLATGIKVNLPSARTAQPLENKEPVVVAVAKDGAVSVGKDPVSRDELAARVKAKLGDSNGVVQLRGDRDAPYGDVVSVMDDLAASGISRIAIVSGPRRPVAPASAAPDTRLRACFRRAGRAQAVTAATLDGGLFEPPPVRPPWLRPVVIAIVLALHAAALSIVYLEPRPVAPPPEIVVDVEPEAPPAENPIPPAEQAKPPEQSAPPPGQATVPAPAEPPPVPVTPPVAAQPPPPDVEAQPSPPPQEQPPAPPQEAPPPPPQETPPPAPVEEPPPPQEQPPPPPQEQPPPAPVELAPPPPPPKAVEARPARPPPPRPRAPAREAARPEARPEPRRAEPRTAEPRPAREESRSATQASRGAPSTGAPSSAAASASSLSAYRGEVSAIIRSRLSYPEAARARGARGMVGVSFAIGPSGAVTSFAITRSSGDRELDAAARSLVEGARFPPPPGGSTRIATSFNYAPH